MVKWIVPLDSTRQTGLETTVTEFLMIDSCGYRGGQNLAGGVLNIGIHDLSLYTGLQPATLGRSG